MSPHRTIFENFRFLLAEVVRQVEDTMTNLKDPSNELIQKIHSQDDYIDNLKNLIEKNCFFQVLGDDAHKLNKREIDGVVALHVAATNLERIADHAVNISKQTRHLHDRLYVNRFDYQSYFGELLPALHQVEKAVIDLDVGLATGICRVEFNLDRRFQQTFQNILTGLRAGGDTENLLTTLFIFRYLERMGDELLNIGEAVISAHLGERLKIHQFKSLEDSIASMVDADIPLGELAYEAFSETRSGARIGRVKATSDMAQSRSVIFKEGKTPKILEEKESLERWNELFPGIAPKVLDYQDHEHNASLLVEFLGGSTFQSLILDHGSSEYLSAFDSILTTIDQIWTNTQKPGPASAGFVKQVRSRVDDIFRLHPELRTVDYGIGPLGIQSFEGVLQSAEEIEKNLSSSVSVLTHGDFNLDNIIYDAEKNQVHYIDLHRSKQNDYVQDVSVFLVSNFRLPAFDTETRDHISAVTEKFIDFAGDWGRRHGDTTFEARLALGVARSLITSTRFVLNDTFARVMFLRAVYLFEKTTSLNESNAADFRFPREVLDY